MSKTNLEGQGWQYNEAIMSDRLPQNCEKVIKVFAKRARCAPHPQLLEIVQTTHNHDNINALSKMISEGVIHWQGQSEIGLRNRLNVCPTDFRVFLRTTRRQRGGRG